MPVTPTTAFTPSRAAARAGTAVLTAVVAVVVVLAGVAGSAPAPSAAPGSGTSAGSAAAVAVDDPADDAIVQNPLGTGAADDDDEGATDAENRRIWAVIAGLVLVAVALTALTVRYWQVTRPVPVDGELEADEADQADGSDDDDGPNGSRRTKGRSARERGSGRPTGRRARGANDQSAADAFDTDDLFVDDPRLPEARGD